MAIYRCSGCGAQVTKGTYVCPACHANLAGVKCLHCGYSGSREEFRNDLCPMCGTSIVPAPEPRYRCPVCRTPLPAIRRPKNRRQALWGGWTCPGCGAELDRSLNVIPAAGPAAPAQAASPFSADGHWWWDGAAWRALSEDRQWWWDGTKWQPLSAPYPAG
jgi:predicted amidophosphoribosyltransferase